MNINNIITSHLAKKKQKNIPPYNFKKGKFGGKRVDRNKIFKI